MPKSRPGLKETILGWLLRDDSSRKPYASTTPYASDEYLVVSARNERNQIIRD